MSAFCRAGVNTQLELRGSYVPVKSFWVNTSGFRRCTTAVDACENGVKAPVWRVRQFAWFDPVTHGPRDLAYRAALSTLHSNLASWSFRPPRADLRGQDRRAERTVEGHSGGARTSLGSSIDVCGGGPCGCAAGLVPLKQPSCRYQRDSRS